MRFAAQLVSVVFHPLLMLTYMLFLQVIVNPYMFGYRQVSEAHTLFVMVFLTSALIPVIAIIVMKGVGWVHSFEMPDKQERIGPYIVTSVLYLTLYLHLVKAKAFPTPLLICTLGSVIVLFVGFSINVFRKISMHAAAVGGLVVFCVILYRGYSTGAFILSLDGTSELHVPTAMLIYGSILIAGAVCTARLGAKRHTPAEVYSGFFLGASAMAFAGLVLG
jgi:hypothetical protein